MLTEQEETNVLLDFYQKMIARLREEEPEFIDTFENVFWEILEGEE